MSIRPKGHFWEIFGSGRPNSQWCRIIFGKYSWYIYNDRTKTLPLKKVTFSTNGPSNDVHYAQKATFGRFWALEDPIFSGLGIFLDTTLVIHIQWLDNIITLIKKWCLCLRGLLMVSIGPKGHLWDIFGSGRPNSHWFRIIFGHTTLDPYTMIEQHHYYHKKWHFVLMGLLMMSIMPKRPLLRHFWLRKTQFLLV